jgi:hypothetical protein
MTKGVPKKRAQASGGWLSLSVVAAKRSRPPVGRATAMPAPLPPAHYPAKRVAIGKRQVPGGAG